MSASRRHVGDLVVLKTLRSQRGPVPGLVLTLFRRFDAPCPPRIIYIPLSGGDRKAQAKGIRHAHGLHETHFRQSVLIRSVAEAKIREADRLECEAWNAIMWAGGPAMPSPGEPQAEPTIAKAINGGFDFLEAQCNRCDRVSLVALRALTHPPDTPVWKLEAALYCEPCSTRRRYSERQRAHILGLTYASPDPELGRMAGRKR